MEYFSYVQVCSQEIEDKKRQGICSRCRTGRNKRSRGDYIWSVCEHFEQCVIPKYLYANTVFIRLVVAKIPSKDRYFDHSNCTNILYAEVFCFHVCQVRLQRRTRSQPSHDVCQLFEPVWHPRLLFIALIGPGLSCAILIEMSGNNNAIRQSVQREKFYVLHTGQLKLEEQGS